jgi:hypothetical protein
MGSRDGGGWVFINGKKLRALQGYFENQRASNTIGEYAWYYLLNG